MDIQYRSPAATSRIAAMSYNAAAASAELAPRVNDFESEFIKDNS